MRRSNFALRVPPSLLAEARKAADSEGVALNQFITLALAEKTSALRTSEYFEERARRANPAKVKEVLARVGKRMLPIESDELPECLPAKQRRNKDEGVGYRGAGTFSSIRKKRWAEAIRGEPMPSASCVHFASTICGSSEADRE